MNMLLLYAIGLWALIPSSAAGTVKGVAVNDTLTIGYFVSWSGGWPTGGFIGSAIILAIQEIRHRHLLDGFEIEWVHGDDSCEPKKGTQVAIEVYASVEDLDCIIGPPCSIVCKTVSLLAAAWEIPIVSWGCAALEFSDVNTHPTFTRTEGTWIARTVPYANLLNIFGWNKVGIITTPEELYRTLSMGIIEEMQKNDKEVFLQIAESTFRGDSIVWENMEKLKTIISEMKEYVRILILMTYPRDLRNMLITCYDLGMMNGDYVLITNAFVLNAMNEEHSFRPEADSFIWNGLLLMGLQLASGPEWDMFRQDIIDAFQDPRFDHLPHLAADAPIEDVSLYTAYVYDAVLFWAYGVNRTVEQGYAPDDGFKVAQNQYNLVIDGMSSKRVALDHVGDRLQDLRILVVQDFKEVDILQWIAADGRYYKVYKPESADDWSGIVWYGNRTTVPGDSPLCGWNGELCDSPEEGSNVTIISLSVSVLVAMSVLIIVIIILRKSRYEANLKAVSDISISWLDLEHNVLGNRKKSIGSYVSVNTVDQNFKQGLNVVQYKDILVVVNPLGDIAIDLQNRNVLIELKTMRDVAHDNVNSFIGICCDPPNVCYLMAFAPKGTLQDIISNSDMSLSKDFKISFILDIACGMWYLHQSGIEVHGNLSSSQCVVDGRWSCKVTGYGLKYVKQQCGFKHAIANKAKLLWTAPELLDNSDIDTHSITSLKQGDVYSYGIISQEVFLTDVPFGSNEPALEPDEIIKRVKSKETPPFRPTFPDGSVPEKWAELIQMCWAEEANKRPSFDDILVKINQIHNYKDLDLVDNMIKRLEKYTHTLEERVASRSRELEGEKIKVETLLKELLPASVAESLAVGKKIEPESFECVSIFFSDIVGFTRISAAGTPLEVVVMLNSMYTMFDDIAHRYDVYKVATIGDAYMVASGVPIRNDNKHAAEICSMALALVDASHDFPIAHLPEEHLVMRIGIHSGACVAGVVGVKMPRYLLFGEAVEMAAKMESSGEPKRVQVSETTRSLVGTDVSFTIEKRDEEITVKGTGKVTTYWINKNK